MSKRIVLTGGGTTGHVAVNLALIPRLLEKNMEIHYIGSHTGIERELVRDFPEVHYEPIATGKLRRYLSSENVKDGFRVIRGVRDAARALRRIKPDAIFSKGGYVSVPVILAGALNRIPALSHESDLTPGLANRLSYPFVKKILLTFEETLPYVPENKAMYIGPVIREQIKGGKRDEGLRRFGFSGKKPILLVMGGSLGAGAINESIWENLDVLLKTFDILHGVGKGKGNGVKKTGYLQVEYIKEGMSDALAMADLIISRSGANAIFEFLYYKKPMILIPLGTNQSRGDQILNAQNFEKKGYARVLLEEDTNPQRLLDAVEKTFAEKDTIQSAQEKFLFKDTTQQILDALEGLY